MTFIYQPALDLTDQVIKQTPNAPVVHELGAGANAPALTFTR